ncbi:sensor domain-containing protein [Streptomyces sp. XD-27]|uniref:sensor domain-containing protein n=1 Tax=Streptomyces sp. XD-27 TaxID=3062779 RepID=UPI0026F461AE|nr:sensor domain-containing protein [Streptomyces sp. XD-27]WKX71038.1 sensor domain-containing protein [Streptomyces sp. XD-27]
MTEMTPPLMAPRAYEPTAHGAGDVGRVGRFGRQLGYLLAGLPVGIAAFVIAVTGFTAGAASFAVVLGLPILVAALAAARAFARVERRQVEAATGRALPAHSYRPRDGGAGPAAWLRALRDPQSWRDLAHMLVAFPLRVASFCIALTWTVGGLGELLYGAWSWSIPRDDDEAGLLDLMFGVDSRLADIAFNTGIGVVLLATAVPVVRGLVAIQAALARGLLTNPTAARTR